MNSLPKKILTLALSTVLSVFTVFSLPQAPAQAEVYEAAEYEVKAAFIYNFAKFVEWPEGALDGTMNICVLGTDHFGSLLDSISGKAVGKRKVALKRTGSLKNIRACNMLFISLSENSRLKEIISAARDSNILTVGDSEGFAQKGLIINLFMDKGKVRFEINLDAARRSGLRISSRLLELARIVRENS